MPAMRAYSWARTLSLSPPTSFLTEYATRIKGEAIPEGKQVEIAESMDTMIRWFCIIFGNQFTPDDVLDGYPVDRLMHDIALALMAVQTQTTEILSEFPTKAAETQEEPKAIPLDNPS